MYKQDEIIIVTCKKYIEFLCNHCDEYLADGTITFKPKYFYQQYTTYTWMEQELLFSFNTLFFTF